jgi:hypothetical protein
MPDGRRFEVEVRAVSRADAATLFALEADGSRWSEWAKPLVPQSVWAGGSPPGGVGSVRLLGLRPLFVREETVELEPDRRHVYAMRTPMPVRDYRAEVLLTPRADGGTDLVWRGSFTERVRGTGPVFRVLVRGLLSYLAGRLVRGAERERA